MGISRRPKDDTGSVPRTAVANSKPNIQKAIYETTKKKKVGVEDLTLISKVTNEAINENLHMRFHAGEIYTYIGHVLVSVNPFRDLGIYTEEVLRTYKGKNRLEMPPHVFAVAESAYYNMNAYKDNQCVIISGESGAGKTEAAKRIMQYIATVSGGSNSGIQEVKDMVLATNPLLESFGNAKTLRNNNSSRFGKYLQLQFNSRGEPVGASITNYLLEKSRVVGQIDNERNFHIFYQFTKGASKEYRDSYGIQAPETYRYTSASKCLNANGIDDLAEYRATLEAMKIIGLSKAEQDEIFRMLAAILWTGNITFGEDKEGYAAVRDQSVVDFLAYLLEVDPKQLIKAITIRILTPRNGEVIESPANPAQAMATRDALAKAIYNNLFDWIVERVNVSLRARETPANSVGILDIYGFEIFEKNSFEQLCINYVNEKLQQIFIQLTLKAEQEEYAREQIQWTPIQYFDNKIVCDLIESIRPPGIFSAMKDATKTAHADPSACDRTFMQSINGMSNPHLTPRSGSFIIKHYAGDVNYNVEGITDKNKDQLLKGLLNLFSQSGNQFVHALFPNQVDHDNRKQPPSAGDKIKASANDLVATLMKATPSYIRTIKPNENKSATEYNKPTALHQVKYLGLQENVRIRRAGFAYRQTFNKFVERFYLLSPQTSYAGDYTWQGDAKSGANQIMKDTSIPAEDWQMGVTKAFIKAPETLFALEHMRDRYWHNMAVRIQRIWRAYLRIRAEAATRIQRLFRKGRAGARYLILRDKGHQLLQGRKERRRMSLLGSRRFIGDYLRVGKADGFGGAVSAALNISSRESVLFSCDGEILENKFGRSSKASPRTFVLTKAKFYIINKQVGQKQNALVVERAIPLGAIKFISMSTSRDDWFSFGVGSPQDADPLMDCVLKTELFTQMSEAVPGAFILKITESIEYAKKPGKMVQVKVLKDSTLKDDFYKSGAVHTHPGKPPNSRSKPTPKGKPKPAKPFTSGRLVQRGGPGGKLSKASVPLYTQAASAGPSQVTGRATQSVAATQSQVRNLSAQSSSVRAPPPPPPSATPSAPQESQWKVLYDFTGQTEREMRSLEVGQIVSKIGTEANGWCMVKDSRQEGWAPSTYIEEVTPPPPAPPAVGLRPTPPPPPIPTATKPNGSADGKSAPAIRAKPAPPALPAKRPAGAGRKAARVPSPTSRDSGLGMNQTSASGTESGRNTPTPSLAGGLAEALRARQSAMQKGRDDDDDW